MQAMATKPRNSGNAAANGRADHWQGVYAAKAETEVSWFQECPVASLRLIHAARLVPGQAVVDVGGGSSRLVDSLLDLGYRVAVLDLAEAALAKTKTRLGGRATAVDWIVADVTQWSPPMQFDLWHDRAVFHFLVDEADRRAYATVMAAAVRPGGQAVVATFGLDGPDRCSGLPVRRYGAGGMAAEFAPAFRLVESRCDRHLTPAGKPQSFQFCRFVRE
jgi:2-polyprenyl-3-methyl-5-hydroxy-6-metoxy-1,4-benzoquinol methylase